MNKYLITTQENINSVYLTCINIYLTLFFASMGMPIFFQIGIWVTNFLLLYKVYKENDY
jgi:hypothetical protein